MFGPKKTHGTLRNLIVAFGTLFNDIHILREDSSGATAQDIKVPIAYGPAEHYIARLREELSTQSLNVDVSMSLPRMSFEMLSLNYDSTRMTTPVAFEIGTTGTTNTVVKKTEGVPYKVPLNLSIYTKHTDDMLQIIEQIAPYFRPDFNVRIKTIPELGIVDDVPILLESISPSDSYEGLIEDGRLIVWDLSFTADMSIYPPLTDLSAPGSYITKVISNVRVDDVGDIERVTTTPLPLGATPDTITGADHVFQFPPLP